MILNFELAVAKYIIVALLIVILLLVIVIIALNKQISILMNDKMRETQERKDIMKK